jgi:hypothetical protein
MRTILIAAIVVFVVGPATVFYANAESVDSETTKLIQQRLQGIQKFVSENKEGFNWLKQLGFDSPQQLTKITIGQKFPLYYVRPGKLKSYEKGTDPLLFITKTGASIYPLLIDQKALSSVTVAFARDKSSLPTRIELGDPTLGRLLTEALTEAKKEGSCTISSECFAVAIPELGLHLFVHRREEPAVLKMVVLNHVRGHVKREDFRTAREVFEVLSNEVRKYKPGQAGHMPDKTRQLEPSE